MQQLGESIRESIGMTGVASIKMERIANGLLVEVGLIYSPGSLRFSADTAEEAMHIAAQVWEADRQGEQRLGERYNIAAPEAA